MKIADNIFFYPEQGMLDANHFVIKDEKSAVMIDSGSTQTLPHLLREMKQDGIKPEDIGIIVNTHLHIDHWANEEFKKISGAKIMVHPLQKKFWDITTDKTARVFGLEPVSFKEDGFLDGNKLNNLTLIAAPGHSPDSICYYDKTSKALVCGDVVFFHNTGRPDLPGGDAAQLKRSIEVLSGLDIEYLLPGHMNFVKGVENVKENFEFIRANVFSWM